MATFHKPSKRRVKPIAEGPVSLSASWPGNKNNVTFSALVAVRDENEELQGFASIDMNLSEATDFTVYVAGLITRNDGDYGVDKRSTADKLRAFADYLEQNNK